MKIQKTTIVESDPGQATVGLVISDHADYELAGQYVVCKVLVSTEAKPPIHDPIAFRLLQGRALKQAIALLDQADDATRAQQP
jgi:hypothetical protein